MPASGAARVILFICFLRSGPHFAHRGGLAFLWGWFSFVGREAFLG